MDIVEIAFDRNRGKNSLFTEDIAINFYDGPTKAFGKLTGTESWVFCNMVYFDIPNNQRIFLIIMIEDIWIERNKKYFLELWDMKFDNYNKLMKRTKKLYEDYCGPIYLMNVIDDWLNSKNNENFQLLVVPLMKLIFYDTMEQVLFQTEEMKTKWKRFFENPNNA